MAEQDDAPLRSLHSDAATHVVFVNRSGALARAWWLDFSGSPVSYGDIHSREGLSMNTYLTHPWIFRATESGARLLANHQDVYFPAPTTEWDESGQPVFLRVLITAPMYSLRERCCVAIRRLVRRDAIGRLDLPEMLKQELRQSPNLLAEIRTMDSRRG
uniref:von Hippel-Lindau disease tumor suppressor n=2 Tax=Denticeps clupeoides TaxID=299321 RepID=A0AAY4DEQ6_9TELE